MVSDDIKQRFPDNISYKEDDDSVVNVYVKILELNDSTVKFMTSGGTIVIVPLHRVLKIKSKEENI